MNDRKVPRLRFKGFVDDWEQRKLEELITKGGSGGTPSAAKPDYYGGSIPFLAISDIKNRDITTTDKSLTEEGLRNSAAWIVPAGAVSLAMYASVGKVGILSMDSATSQAFFNMVFDDSILRHFVYYRLVKADLGHEWEPLISTGTQRNLNAEKVKQFEISIPQREEMKRIGDFLWNLDNLITLHQRKLKKLKIIKKSMLENCFPKNGEKVPKIRFSGFTGDWEQRKLGEIADIVGGGTPSTSISEFWNGDIDWYAPAEIAGQIYLTSSQRKITEQGYSHSSAKILPVGTVLFTSRAGIGKTAILSRKGCTNQGFQSIVPHKDELDSYFIFSRTEELKQYGETVGAGSTFAEVSGKQMANMELMIPKTITEQKIIGQYFTNLDRLITLHQRQQTGINIYRIRRIL